MRQEVCEGVKLIKAQVGLLGSMGYRALDVRSTLGLRSLEGCSCSA